MPTETITDCFPSGIRASAGTSEVGYNGATVVEPLADGWSSQRRGRLASDRMDMKITTEPLTEAGIQPVRDFLIARKGQLIPFYIFLLNKNGVYVAEPIGTSTAGPGQVLAIPFRESVVSALYVNAVSKPFTEQSATGTFGEDQVTITGAQTASLPVTIDLTGRKRFGVRLTADRFAVTPVQKTAGTRFVIQFAVQEV